MQEVIALVQNRLPEESRLGQAVIEAEQDLRERRRNLGKVEEEIDALCLALDSLRPTYDVGEAKKVRDRCKRAAERRNNRQQFEVMDT